VFWACVLDGKIRYVVGNPVIHWLFTVFLEAPLVLISFLLAVISRRWRMSINNIAEVFVWICFLRGISREGSRLDTAG